MDQILKQKNIVLVPFPFSDQSGMKRRPALIISSDKFNKDSEDIIICAITSNIDTDKNSVLIRKEDWKAGMYSESSVKTAIILTIAKKMIIKQIGRLSNERFKEVMEKILEHLK